MAATSPGSRLQPLQQAEVKVATLDDPETQKAISTLRLLLENSYGVEGQMALLHNNTGGHVSMTSSSGRVLPLLSIKNPVIRLIYTTLIGHVNTYKDCGLFTGLFTLSLIQESLNLDIHRRLVLNILGTINEICSDFLNSKSCIYRINYNTLNIDTMTKVVRSCLSPKSGCGLMKNELENMCSTIVRVFLKSISTDGSLSQYKCDIAYLSIEGKPPSESHIIDGIMFEAPQYPVYLKDQPTIKCLKTGSHQGLIKTALVGVSLSGDSDLHTDATFEISDESISISDTMVEVISDFARHLLDAGVGVLLSQKVVHPKVKGLLRDGSVLVVDRLGKVVAGHLEKLTGCVPIKSFAKPNLDQCYGYLQSLTHKVYNRKSYLHFQGVESTEDHPRECTPVCTLVLCNRSEEALAELKYNCESAVKSLRLLAHSPVVLAGAGCWQTGMLHHIQHVLHERETELSTKHHCTKYQLQQISIIVRNAMYKTLRTLWRDSDLYTDTEQRHLVAVPFNTDIEFHKPPSCACGAVKFDAKTEFINLNNFGTDFLCNSRSIEKIGLANVEIVDVAMTAVNAVRVSMGTAAMVIGVHNYISDKN